MKSGCIFSFCLFFAFFTISQSHESVIEDISEEEFASKFIEFNTSILMFFAPWCGHCKNFLPIYDKFITLAETELTGVLVAKIDGTKSSKLAQKYQITGYPTILMLKKDKVCKYAGERELQNLMTWSKSIVTPAVVNSVIKVDNILASPLSSILAYFQEEGSELEGIIIDLICQGSISVPGGVHFIHNKEFAEKLKLNQDKNLFVWKSGAEPIPYTGEPKAHDISLFLAFASNPLVLEYSMAASSAIFHQIIENYLFFHLKKTDIDVEQVVSILEKVANAYFGIVRVSWVDVESEDGKSAVGFFGVTHTPSLVILNYTSGVIYSDVSESVTKIETIKIFVEKYLEKTLKPHLKQEPIPENWNSGPVYQLVTGNFEEVLKWGKLTFVMFYAPWCGHCKALMPDWEKLGEIYKASQDKTEVVIAKLDSTQNDIEGISVTHFPTLIGFLPNGSKITYSGERTFDALKIFIDSGFVEVGDSEKVGAEKPIESDQEESDPILTEGIPEQHDEL